MLSVPDVIHVMRSKASPDETQEIGCALCCQPRRSIGVVKDVQMPGGIHSVHNSLMFGTNYVRLCTLSLLN